MMLTTILVCLHTRPIDPWRVRDRLSDEDVQSIIKEFQASRR